MGDKGVDFKCLATPLVESVNHGHKQAQQWSVRIKKIQILSLFSVVFTLLRVKKLLIISNYLNTYFSEIRNLKLCTYLNT